MASKSKSNTPAPLFAVNRKLADRVEMAAVGHAAYVGVTSKVVARASARATATTGACTIGYARGFLRGFASAFRAG